MSHERSANESRQLLSKSLAEFEDDGKFSTEKKTFRLLRDMVRASEAEAESLPRLLLSFLGSSSSVTRLYALQVTDYFYCRSCSFRLSFNTHLMEVLVLVAETDPLHYPLPGSRGEAEKLKLAAISTFKRWDDRFGEAYVPLKSAVNKLASLKTMDFQHSSAETSVERRRKEAAEAKKVRKAQEVAEGVRREFEESKEEMKRVIEEARSALFLLIPAHGFFDSNNASGDGNSNEPVPFSSSAHGYRNGEEILVSLHKSIPSIVVSEANEDIFQTVRDAAKMLSSYEKRIASWIRETSGNVSAGSLVSELLSMRREMLSQMEKIKELERNATKERGKTVDSDGEEDEFVDVEEEVEPLLLSSLKAECSGGSRVMADDMAGTSGDDRQNCRTEENDSRPPRIAFGLDLKYWGEKNVEPAQIVNNNCDSHRFWRAPEDREEHAESREAYTTRVITFVGKELRGKKACRTPLKNGKLCPRMDILRCPVHGVIIERDEMGFPLEEQPESSEQAALSEKREEEEYMRDLEGSLGASLQPSTKRMRKEERKKREAPSEGRLVRDRLEAKLLNPRSVKRVSEVFEEMRRVKIQKKFGEQTSHR